MDTRAKQAYFNTSHVSINRRQKRQPELWQNYFNTSHVSINQRSRKTCSRKSLYFNTSHVSINLSQEGDAFNTKNNFNTSHVSINRYSCSFFPAFPGISIHLMLLLIATSISAIVLVNNDFNTSHVSINPRWSRRPSQTRSYFNTSHVSINLPILDEFAKERKFQYISCFY